MTNRRNSFTFFPLYKHLFLKQKRCVLRSFFILKLFSREPTLRPSGRIESARVNCDRALSRDILPPPSGLLILLVTREFRQFISWPINRELHNSLGRHPLQLLRICTVLVSVRPQRVAPLTAAHRLAPVLTPR
jgi:hypothetical protein